MSAPLDELRPIVARIGIASVYAHALRPPWDGVAYPAETGDGYRINDEAYADALVRRFPDGPDGPRWLIVGSDWEDDAPFQRDETPEAHIEAGANGPGAPAWLGLHGGQDVSALTDQVCPGTLTWFEDGRWQVSGRRLDRVVDAASGQAARGFGPLDPVRPWTDDALQWAFKPFVDDEPAVAQLAALLESVADRELVDETALDELARTAWNAAVTPEVAHDPDRFGAHLRALHGRLTVREPSAERIAEAVERLATLRRRIDGPPPLRPQPGPAELAPALDGTADRVAANAAMVRALGERAAAEAAARIAPDRRSAVLGPHGLRLRVPGVGWAHVSGLDPERIAVAGRGGEGGHRVRHRTDQIWLFGAQNQRMPVPDWLPRDAIEAATDREAAALAWTERGLWRGAQRAREDALASGAFAALRAVVERSAPAASWRPGSRREAAEIRAAIEAFLAGRGVLAAGAPSAYAAPPAEPIEQARRRAVAAARMRRAVERWGCHAALALVLLPADPPPAPPVADGEDPLEWQDRHPEPEDAGLGLRAERAADEALSARIAAAHGLAGAPTQQLSASVEGLAQIIGGNRPDGDPRAILTRFADGIGVAVDRERLDEAAAVVRRAGDVVRRDRIPDAAG